MFVSGHTPRSTSDILHRTQHPSAPGAGLVHRHAAPLSHDHPYQEHEDDQSRSHQSTSSVKDGSFKGETSCSSSSF